MSIQIKDDAKKQQVGAKKAAAVTTTKERAATTPATSQPYSSPPVETTPATVQPGPSPPAKQTAPNNKLSPFTAGLLQALPSKEKFIVDCHGRDLPERRWHHTSIPQRMCSRTVTNNANKLWQVLFAMSSGNAANARLILDKLAQQAQQHVQWMPPPPTNQSSDPVDKSIADSVGNFYRHYQRSGATFANRDTQNAVDAALITACFSSHQHNVPVQRLSERLGVHWHAVDRSRKRAVEIQNNPSDATYQPRKQVVKKAKTTTRQSPNKKTKTVPTTSERRRN